MRRVFEFRRFRRSRAIALGFVVGTGLLMPGYFAGWQWYRPTRVSPATGDRMFKGVQRWTLPNGLKVIAQEDHSAPQVAVQTFYHVGGRNDPLGQYGMAHLLEHMTFRGTGKLRAREIDGICEGWGGYTNGTTDRDCTEYQEILPSAGLKDALAIEADRMVNARLDPADLTLEKQVVLDELRVSNSSAGNHLWIAVLGRALPGLPYGHSSGGNPADLQGITPEALRRFYRTYYSPANTTLVVTGDFRLPELESLIRSDFGPVKRGIPTPRFFEPACRIRRQQFKMTGPGPSPEVIIAFPAPPLGTVDHDALNVALVILAGRGGRLDTALADRRVAFTHWWDFPDAAQPFLLKISARPGPGDAPGDVQLALENELQQLADAPVSADELSRAVKQIAVSFILQAGTATGRGYLLGHYDAMGQPDYARDGLRRISGVTAQEVQDAVRRWLNPTHRIVGTYVPAGTPNRLNADRQTPAAKALTIPATEALTYPGATDISGPSSGSDAAIRAEAPPGVPADPAPTAALLKPFRQLPRITDLQLASGLEFVVLERHSAPRVDVVCDVRAGQIDDPPGKAGLSACTASYIGGSSDRWLENAGAGVETQTSASFTEFSAYCLAQDFTETLSKLSQEITAPRFRPAAVSAGLQRRNASERGLKQDPSRTASVNLKAARYAPGNPLRWPLYGTEETRRHITGTDMSAFHATYYRPERTVIAVVGDVRTSDVTRLIQQCFGNWKPRQPGPEATTASEPMAPAGHRVTAPASDSEDATTYLVGRGIPGSDRAYPAGNIAIQALCGAGLPSRLLSDARQRGGLLYWADADLNPGDPPYEWWLVFRCRTAVVPELIDLSFSEMQRLKDSPLSGRELVFYRNSLIGKRARWLGSGSATARFIAYATCFHQGATAPWRDPFRLASVTPSDVQRAARRIFRPDLMTISTAGPPPSSSRG